MSTEEAYKIVLEDLKKCNLFCGIYDAKNGKDSFMHGICTVMENIACSAKDENFSDIFMNNMIESQKKAGRGDFYA